MKTAVIKTGGKQYVVSEGTEVKIELLSGKQIGDSVTFDTLLIDTGSEISLGSPVLSEKVTGTILSEGRHEKRVVVKYKAKSRYHKKKGHRQHYARVKIDKI